MAYKDPEKQRAAKKAYYEANREREKAHQKAYREANREKKKAVNKAWYEANSEKIKAYSKAYYEANPEKVKAAYKVYREANSERLNTYNKTWFANPLNAAQKSISKLTGLKKAEIPTELLEAQALIIQIHREIRNHEKLHRA